jgi:flagellar L-ring protein precursor FlgH
MKRLPVQLAALCLALAACAPSHIGTYVPKHRDYAIPTSSGSEDAAASPGSLWRPGRSAALLFTDARALRENDLVVVRIEEIADAERTADTDLTHNSQVSATLNAFLRSNAAAIAAAAGSPQVSGQLQTQVQNSFNGDGSMQRTEHLTATVPAIVRKVMPNGNLFVEGHRVVLVNSEEHHFYISGVVRPIDIDQQNSVKSSMLADAEVEFTGRGDLTDNQRQGFLQRYFGWIWPF